METFNSLLISLCIIASGLSGNEQGSFNQKFPDQSSSMHENLDKKYKISGAQILKGANIAGATVGFGIGAYVLSGEESDKLMAALMLAAGAMLNGASAIVDSQKNPKMSTGLGIANAAWGLGNIALSFLCRSSAFFPFEVYWGLKGSLNFANAAYRLWYAKKQQN